MQSEDSVLSVITETTPQDRLTRLGAEMTNIIESDADYKPGDRGIVMLTSGPKAGVVLFGYEESDLAIEDLLKYLEIIIKAHGKRLNVKRVKKEKHGT